MSHRSRILSLAAVSALALTACGSEPQMEETTEAPTTTATESVTTSESATEEFNADRKVGLNEPVTLTCGGVRDQECMTVTFADLDATASCPESSTPESRFVSLSIEAEMPQGADPDFVSPFRGSPWAAVTDDGRRTNVMSEAYCHGGPTESDLSAEFPGYSATGVAYLPVPDNTREIHFAASRDSFVILPLEAAGAKEEPGASESQSEQSAQEAPVITSQPPAPAPGVPEPTQAPAPPVAEAPAAPSSPVMGFTGAPGADPVRELDKSISSCGDLSMHQPGTTFFTDGTSGWTQHCSDQMLGG